MNVPEWFRRETEERGLVGEVTEEKQEEGYISLLRPKEEKDFEFPIRVKSFFKFDSSWKC